MGEAGPLLKTVGVLVLGMHRSGTSAVARLLYLAGATPPRNILGPTPGNPEGYWEPTELVKLNTEMLEDVGRTWFDWRRCRRPIAEAYVQQLDDTINDQYGAADLFVLKDPRACRLLPQYAESFNRLRITPFGLLMLRNPVDVSSSLYKRNGLGREYGLLLWLRYVLEAERESRGMHRYLIEYEDLLQDWRSALLSSGIPLNLEDRAAEIDASLKPDLRHNAGAPPTGDGTLDRWVAKAYSALRRLKSNAVDEQAMSVLDDIHERFDEATDATGDAMYAEIRRLQEKNAELRARLA